MLSCRKAAERLSQSLDTPLPTIDRIALGSHMVICSSCRKFRRQFLSLHSASQKALYPPEGATSEVQLSEEKKHLIALQMERSGSVTE